MRIMNHYYPPCTSFKYEMDLVEGGVVDMRDHRHHHSSESPPFNHLANDQAKSLVVLQELQNEVGALLEFRDVVMETFPQLRAKLRCGSQTGGGAVPATSTRWEPGIRVRRKQRCTDLEQPQLRSRSNSRSKGGGGVGSASSVVQDSGFCTESSKKNSEPEDELWCLLELIQNKGTRLRLEVESLKDKYGRSRSLGELGAASPPAQLVQANHAYQALLHEKELLLDRVTEMEAENLAQAAETSELTTRLNRLAEEKRQLELLLGTGLPAPAESGAGPPVTEGTSSSLETTPLSNQPNLRLGTLDGIVSTPTQRIHCPKGVTPDKEVTAAILRETNVIELQRHLITTTYENQVIQRRFERISKCKANLLQQLEKFKEENEDLRFQLEEKSIELEGTRARIRLLEKQTSLALQNTPPHHITGGIPTRNSSSGGETGASCGEDNSSTESAHGHGGSSPRRRPPSRIPLKSYTAPKPPSAPPNSLRRSPRPQQQQQQSAGELRTPTPAIRKATPRNSSSSSTPLQSNIQQASTTPTTTGTNSTDDSKSELRCILSFFVELDSLEKASTAIQADRSLRSVELYDSIDTSSWRDSSGGATTGADDGGDEAMADLDSLENNNSHTLSSSAAAATSPPAVVTSSVATQRALPPL
ncbi:javelin-like isoform X4 [Rhodnius prolixus]|uniref:javelin-like isoform X4 n=1 Tax=Rhodnius prolixus TaxID=13249 RepID=UPI003D18ABB6